MDAESSVEPHWLAALCFSVSREQLSEQDYLRFQRSVEERYVRKYSRHAWDNFVCAALVLDI